MKKACLIFLAMVANTMVWAQDLGNGSFRNPILYADYSDPDAIRVGEDYYMTSSSFNCSPGLQILHSRDLVNWEIISAALPHAIPGGTGAVVEHGNQVWAPSIRHQAGTFYITWGDPDVGIYQVHAQNAAGPWSEPYLLMPGTGYIDACPFWDENGRTWLVHALAGSRAGLKSVLCLAEVDATLTKVITPSRVIFDGHKSHPTCEGPKMYKKDGFYYIFHPAGGVATGWQTVLRSSQIYGPYEEKIVMRQGASVVNGPHQGAWVTTPKGEDWFLHFQDVGALGRLVHLQPMTWKNGWPVIGEDKDGDGCGEPVFICKKPDGHPSAKKNKPGEIGVNTLYGTDYFSSTTLDLKWQWHGKPEVSWYFLDAANSRLRLYSQPEHHADGSLGDATNLWNIPNLLLQKPSAPSQTITAKVALCPTDKYVGERGGLVMMGLDYAAIVLENTQDGIMLKQVACTKADRGGEERVQATAKAEAEEMYLRLSFETQPVDQKVPGNEASSDRLVYAWFSYSTNGFIFHQLGERFVVKQGKWIGAKYGVFCTRPGVKTNDGGWLDVYDIKVE